METDERLRELRSGRHMSRDVVILRWPEQAVDVERLERMGVPRLLLVEPDAKPPSVSSCIEDWIRFPAKDADVRARVAALALRAARHPVVPALDDHGLLSYRGSMVSLSPAEHNLADVLLEKFGGVVANEELVGGDGVTQTTDALRIRVFRLRGRIASLGLTIENVRGVGYLMCDRFAVHGRDTRTDRPGAATGKTEARK